MKQGGSCRSAEFGGGLEVWQISICRGEQGRKKNEDGKMMFAVIMAGGKGERFWPLSREKRPKQMLNLFGEMSLIEQTVMRLTPLLPPERILIVTNNRYLDRIHSLLPQIPTENLIGEPAGRDTAPCVALAAGIVKARSGGEDAVMLLLPSDHCIVNVNALICDLKRANRLAETSDSIVTIGIRPDFPSSDYGYIECGELIGKDDGIRVRRFREKPDRNTAEEFLRAGNFLWNSGMFAWRVSTILAEMKKNAPPLGILAERIASAWGLPGFSDVLCREYEKAPKISIDYAVMEKAAKIIVLPASFDWDDIGNWTALRNHIEPDEKNNIIHGNAELLDCRDCIVYAEGEHLVSGIGLDHLVVIETGDATLICKDTSTPKIKELLKKISRDRKFLEHL